MSFSSEQKCDFWILRALQGNDRYETAFHLCSQKGYGR